jgi:hypothetical protein
MNDDDWADLHGEWDAVSIPHRPSKSHIWCDRCEVWVDPSDLKRWTGDDMLHRLCPGCDADLMDPEIMEE